MLTQGEFPHWIGRRWISAVCAAAACASFGCEDDLAVTSSVTEVVKLTSPDESVLPGESVTIGLQVLDGSSGVNGLRVCFASASSKLAKADGGSTVIVTTEEQEFNGPKADGIAKSVWNVGADAEEGQAYLFGYLMADAGESTEGDRSKVFGVITWTIEIEAQ